MLWLEQNHLPLQKWVRVGINIGILLITLQSAFISTLSKFGLDFFSLFVVDLMHEFELGVWKAVFMHLVWILHTQDAEVIAEFDRR